MRTYAPPPTPPSTFSSGTSQSWKTSSQVSEPLMPSLSSFCAVENQRVDAQVAVGPGAQPHRTGTPAYPLNGEGVFQIAHVRPTVLLRGRHPQKAQLAQARPKVPGEGILPVYLLRPGGDLRLSEITHRLPEKIRSLPQIEIQCRI